MAWAALLAAGCKPQIEVSSQARAISAVQVDPAERGPELSPWPQWRGVDASGIAPGAAPPAEFGPEQHVRWKTPLPGHGNSSPVVWGNYILLTSEAEAAKGTQLNLLAIDRRDGRTLWNVPVATTESGTHVKNGHASASVATDGQRVFVFFGSAGLFAYDLAGQPLWHAGLGPLEHIWGVASSPVLFDDLVIQQCDFTGNSFIAAFEKNSGKERWRTPRASEGSWSTPVFVEAEIDAKADAAPANPEQAGARQRRTEMIVNGSDPLEGSDGLVIAYDPHDGRELWRVRGTTSLVTPTPIVCGGFVFSTSGRNGPIIAIRPGGSGDVTDRRVVWKANYGGPYIPTGLGYRNRLYILGDVGNLVCYDPGNGKTIWSTRLRGMFTASLVAANGLIFAASEQGDVYVFAAGDEYQPLGRNRFGERILATPAIVEGEMILRTETSLYCIEAGKGAPSSAGRPPADAPRGKATEPTIATPEHSAGRTPRAQPSDDRVASVLSADHRQATAHANDNDWGPPGLRAWPLFRGDATASGISAGTLAESLDTCWHVPLTDGEFQATAVIADGRVFIGSFNKDFYCFALSDGRELWRLPNEAGFAATAAVRGGRVYVGDRDGTFFCLDAADGRPQWTFPTESEIDSAPNFYRDTVLVGSQDSFLYCLKADDGSEVWRYDAENQVRSLATIVDNRAMVAGCDGRLHVIDLDRGQKATAVELGGPTGSTAAVLGDRAFVGTETGVFIAIDWRNARELWRFESPAPGAAFRSSAAVTPELVVVGCSDRTVRAFNPAKEDVRWSFPAPSRVDGSPLIVGSRVFIGSDDGRLYALNLADGHELWRFEAGGKILAAPAMAEGRLVIGTDQGDLYCLGVKEAAASR